LGFGVFAINHCNYLHVDMLSVCQYEYGAQEWSKLEIHIFLKYKVTLVLHLSLGLQWEKEYSQWYVTGLYSKHLFFSLPTPAHKPQGSMRIKSLSLSLLYLQSLSIACHAAVVKHDFI
jgi:hypothetical protein